MILNPIPRRVFFYLFFIATIDFCLADNDNLHDFCPTDTSGNNQNSVFVNGLPCKNPANVTASDFKTSALKGARETDIFMRSSTKIVTAADFPGLNTLGLGLGRTDLDVDGVVAPHSHPRAAEMMFVSKGEVIVGFTDTRNRVFQKFLKEGDVFIVPKGMVHFCFNTGFEFSTVFSVYNSQNPGLIDISGIMFGSDLESARNISKRLVEKAVDRTASQTKPLTPHSEL